MEFRKVEPPKTISPSDWHDWKWQFRNSLKTLEDFQKWFELSETEKAGFSVATGQFKIQTTPYYASLASPTDSLNPIRRIFMPHQDEATSGYQQMRDPLGEIHHSPVPRIIHRYPDRLLFLPTDLCSVYCRYCTRKHFTGKDQAFLKTSEYERALAYIRQANGVREVILSGGDPLTLSDSQLYKVLTDLREIPHIEIIRIGTRMPVVNPMRLTKEFVAKLKSFHPVYMMVHFNHPEELTDLSAEALSLLVDNGFPTFNQMVLLDGVNNHPALVQALSRRLLYLRVKPYYMFQCDPSEGTDHLRTPLEQSLEIQKELWGRLSGLAMPNLSLDIPGGGGKVGFTPSFLQNQNDNCFTFKGWDGIEHSYISPEASQSSQPEVSEAYLEEWERLKQQEYGAKG